MAEKTYSVNLPQTEFPMKANSAVREPEFQRMWDEEKIYEKNLANRKDGLKFVVHDGPPYLSSGKIHMGHALNKTLKDIVTKYKAQQGFYSPYVPGYDSHGLPIETAVLKEVKGGRAAFTPLELRRRCKEFALGNLKGQETNFRRLGIWGDWAHPYITLDPKFEAAQLRVFGKMAGAGYLYKGLKTVNWCTNCETALAEAEVEYADHTSESIFVKFPLKKEHYGKLPVKLSEVDEVSFVIWTTTPWTLPANLGIALNPKFTYHFLKTPNHGVLVIADELKEQFLAAVSDNNGWQNGQVTSLASVLGKDLERLECSHPFIDRTSLVILGDHVTSEAGTGCVHTAPGHGAEDFQIGQEYGLEILCPVDGRGIFTEEAGRFAGMHYNKANQPIVEHLKELNKLVQHSQYRHSYPHCWRCKKPLIFRATEQWFASVDGFRQKALDAVDTCEWIPQSGRNRIYTMIENRSDWCISRQRAWGVPLPVFYCQGCNKPLLTVESVEAVASVVENEGSDAWWEHDAKYFLQDKFKCESCNGKDFIKEVDIMDVWFDSGVTHHAVLDLRPELKGTPCELYLEGSDQHRGWFQSSLLTSVAVNGRAPYKTVLTHGFIVDESGRKMSKSMGNMVEPDEVIKQYGADVLRLWVASVNYTDDVPIGKNLLAQLAEVYRKLRNTARYLLGNLSDFDPKDKVSYDKLSKLDAYILHKLQEVVAEITQDFDRFEFFKYYQLLQNFCVVDLSSFYFDIVKDRLYTGGKNSVNRRAVQTVLSELLSALVRLLVPVTPHLAEDIWQHMPEKLRDGQKSVLLTDFPKPNQEFLRAELDEFWSDVIQVRSVVNKALETARAARKFGSSLESKVLVSVEDKNLESKLQTLKDELAGIFITSQAQIVPDATKGFAGGSSVEPLAQNSEEGISVVVLAADGTKCPRCWKFAVDVGTESQYPELCQACAKALIADAG